MTDTTKAWFALVALVALVPGCPAPTGRVEETLAAEGYGDVDVGGPALLACSDSERYSREFAATRDGRRVEGVVCCTGLVLGGCTVRHR